MSLCNHCGIELNDDNWYKCYQNNHNYMCISCHKLKCSIQKKSKIYDEYNKNYAKLNREHYNIYMRNYNKTKIGKEIRRRADSKRERELGWIPLNDPFDNCEGHHINMNDVIYIPKEWNQNIKHNVRTGKNMEIINAYAFFFLMMQNIDKIKW